jgi:putative resolvase
VLDPSGDMSSDEFRPAKWFTTKFGISANSLRGWEARGILKHALRCPGGKRLYSVGSVLSTLGSGADAVLEPAPQKVKYAYARVSSAKQKEDLERQVAMLHDAYPNHTIVKDVGSGLKRRGLRTLLDAVYRGVVGEIVVLHKDRLCRFAADLLEYIFVKAGVKLVVHCPSQDPDEYNDLADDFLAVTTFFVASHNGKRSAAHRRERKRRRADAEGTADPSAPEL